MIDSHSHSKHSHDGRATCKELMSVASEKKLEYFSITEHYDRDYLFGKWERFCRQLNLKRYKNDFFKQKSLFDNKTYFAFGIELGYHPKLEKKYTEVVNKYKFDNVILSVHTLNGVEAYWGKIFVGKTQSEVYNEYLDTLIKSVNSSIPYNIVGHIGYVTRYAKYENKSLFQEEYFDKIDVLLKDIIKKNVTIEINTHIKDDKLIFLPEIEILKRYKELGGENITFSGDAHKTCDIGKNYDKVVEIVKKLGFSNWTVYMDRKATKKDF